MNSRYFKFKDIVIDNIGDYILEEAPNLETGTATNRKINYIDTDGVDYKDIFYSERAFEINGHIKAKNEFEMVQLKRKLQKSCSLKEEFQLEYFNRCDSYIANCRFDKLPTFGKRKAWWLSFTLYVTIPSFYWLSYKEYNVSLFRYVDLFKNTFTLPCIFSKRINSAKIYNNGDCETYPVFKIQNTEVFPESSIIIENKTSNKNITINYVLSQNEIVTVDTFNETVTSNINGNITPSITLDTEFFALEVGNNSIECSSIGNIVTAIFRERFLGV